MSFTAEIRDSITLGIGPGSDIATFLTFGLGNSVGGPVTTGRSLQFTLPESRLEYTLNKSKLEYTASGRMEYTMDKDSVP